jgi:hypothetical protein
MQIEKLRSEVLAVSIVVSIALSSVPGAAQQPSATKPAAPSAAQQSAPKSKDIMLAAIKALGGDEFFEPKPYTLSFTSVYSVGPDSPKTIKSNDTYKNRKYYSDCTVLIKRIGKPLNSKCITDLDKDEMWESEKGGAWRKANYVVRPRILFIGGKKTFDNLIFDNKTPQIIQKDNEEYYKVETKYAQPENKDWTCVYLINKSNNLIYEKQDVNVKESVQHIYKYEDYTKVGNIMFPQKRLMYGSEERGVAPVLWGEETISNFTFRDDIPDSLFVVPTKK